MDANQLKALVQEALNNAKDNGIGFVGMNAQEIAIDMLTFDAALEDQDLEEVTKIVEELLK